MTDEFIMSTIITVVLVWIPLLWLIASTAVKFHRFVHWWMHGSCSRGEGNNQHIMIWSRTERTRMLYHCELCGACTWDTTIDRDIEIMLNNT